MIQDQQPEEESILIYHQQSLKFVVLKEKLAKVVGLIVELHL